ncbi:hypothetical protein AGMMS4956_05700 [Bacteroidia bacterium]|nr:hypothetical protein AGMMS4956_05700 [Bacteroidia bacterium]
MNNKLTISQSQEQVQSEQAFYDEVKQIIHHGQSTAYRAINNAMLETYWHLGRRIVEQEQQGKERADYGVGLLKRLSVELHKTFNKGYSVTNLQLYRQFYLVFPELVNYYTLCNNLQSDENQHIELQLLQLSWSHIRSIMRVDNREARKWYIQESAEQTWSIRTLDRNIGSQYYERMLLSQHKDLVKKEMIEKTTLLQDEKLKFIKNPIVTEFLGLANITDFTETDLESAIISNLQHFLMELGKGFAFVSRQQHIRTEERDYYIDMVFYNYILKCFVLIDLKTTQITYQDVGQMDMYVQMYDKLKRTESDNSTIGIILCSETDSDVARYSTLNKSDQLFSSKYKLYMPTEDELRKEIEKQKEIYRLQMNNTNE